MSLCVLCGFIIYVALKIREHPQGNVLAILCFCLCLENSAFDVGELEIGEPAGNDFLGVAGSCPRNPQCLLSVSAQARGNQALTLSRPEKRKRFRSWLRGIQGPVEKDR